MSIWLDEQETTCSECGQYGWCVTSVEDGDFVDLDSRGRVIWVCEDCMRERYGDDWRTRYCDDEEEYDEEEHGDVGRVWCGNCGELVYPDEDDETCPECGCNVYM
ncbi:MAG: hypothetical protein IKW38_07510 [Kiritimatiellae bacterium]|nr:hypothetical protein [Kiritimatiellia bacterium]